MCGILGAFLPGGVDSSCFKSALEKISSRGPDGECVQAVGPGLFGHTRLAFMDLDDRAAQPFFDATRRFIIVFNGEIYNFKELREELNLPSGYFRTESDTEVLLEGFIRHGEEFLRRIDGMFAFAIYDTLKEAVYLYRDQFGIKPLYYTSEDGEFIFSSQIEPITDLSCASLALNLDFSSVTEALRYGYIPGNNTAYCGVFSVPKGGCLSYCIKTGKFTVSKWYKKPNNLISVKARSVLAAEVKDAVLRSVDNKMVSDVPVGLFLSGGIDSSVIAASVSELGFRNLKSYTFSWPGNDEYDESYGARLVAEKYQLDPVFVNLDFDAAEVIRRLDRVLASHYQPFINPTVILTDILSERASEDVKAVLVGDAGDEVFCGYPRYKATNIVGQHSVLARLSYPFLKTWLAINKTESPVGNHIRRRIRKFVEAGFSPDKAFDHYTTLFPLEALKTAPQSRSANFSFLRELFNYKGSYLKACQECDMESFLPFNLLDGADRASMLNGLEIRLPFLSQELYELSLRLPDSARVSRYRQKEILTMAFEDDLPREVVKAKKRGFNPPVWHWLKENPSLLDPLRQKDSIVTDFIHPDYLKSKLRSFDSGVEDSSMMLWGAIVVNRWGQLYV